MRGSFFHGSRGVAEQAALQVGGKQLEGGGGWWGDPTNTRDQDTPNLWRRELKTYLVILTSEIFLNWVLASLLLKFLYRFCSFGTLTVSNSVS